MPIHEVKPRIRVGFVEVGRRVGKVIEPGTSVTIAERTSWFSDDSMGCVAFVKSPNEVVLRTSLGSSGFSQRTVEPLTADQINKNPNTKRKLAWKA